MFFVSVASNISVFVMFGKLIGAVRLAALSGHRILYIMTHDSIGKLHLITPKPYKL